VSDYGMHKDNLKELVMFNSSNEGKLTTLAEYVGRMNADQKYIYFALGDSVSAINNLPQTEILKDKGYEYLCCVEEIDEFALQILHTYADKEFRSVLNDDLGIEQEEKPAEEKETQTEVIKFIADVLGDKVSEVTVSNKLKSHAVCLTAKGGVSFEMEKYFSQIQPDSNMKAQKVLELNMEHNALKKLQSEFTVNKDRATKMAKILYNQALLIAGLPIENPTEYASLVCDLF
jgi:molecular chaperone HtpG